MIVGALVELGTSIIGGVRDHFEGKRELKKAKTNAKIERLRTAQVYDQKWEILQIENSGWKDDVLFYAFILMFIWSGFNPEGAKEFFENLSVLPPWFIKTWMWLVASVIGVKKIGDYAPRAIKEIKDAFKE